MNISTGFSILLTIVAFSTFMSVFSMADEWEATLTANSNDLEVEAQKLTYKTVIGSTDEFDAGRDTPAPPKAPAPVKLDIFFPVAGNPFVTRLRTDARAPAETVTWTFNLQADVTGGDLSWDISRIPPDHTVVLSSGKTIVDMQAIASIPYDIGTTAYTITLEKTATNNAPIAVFQSLTTDEDTPAKIILMGSDADGDDLTYQLLDQPMYGTLAGIASNLTYTPAANYHGDDYFSFQVSDGKVNSTTATVTITINAVNDRPTAMGLPVTTNEDTPIPLSLVGRDIDGDQLSYEVVGQPSYGTLAGTAPDLVYTPEADYHGDDYFSFQVNDGTVYSQAAYVSLAVVAVNDAPTAVATSLVTAEDHPLEIVLTGADIDGDNLTYRLVESAVNGQLTAITDGTLTYTPDVNYNGSDRFIFVVSDDKLSSENTAVQILVTPVNDPPIALDQREQQRVEFTTETAIISLQGQDVDEDEMSYLIGDPPLHGQLSGQGPNLIYTPGISFTGTDQFTFKVSDGTADSDLATVEIIQPFLPFTFEVPGGISLIHLPLTVEFVDGQPNAIQTVGDLFDILGTDNVSILVTYSKADKTWVSYLGDRSRGSRADQPILPDLGIISVMKQTVTLDLLGKPLAVERTAEIHLQRGLNLVGVPVRDPRLSKVGDLFLLPEFANNVTALIVQSADSFKVLAHAGDPGDFNLTGAEALVVTATADTVIVVSGGGWANTNVN